MTPEVKSVTEAALLGQKEEEEATGGPKETLSLGRRRLWLYHRGAGVPSNSQACGNTGNCFTFSSGAMSRSATSRRRWEFSGRCCSHS